VPYRNIAQAKLAAHDPTGARDVYQA